MLPKISNNYVPEYLETSQVSNSDKHSSHSLLGYNREVVW